MVLYHATKKVAFSIRFTVLPMAIPLKNLVPHLIKKDDSWQVALLSNWNTIVGNLKTKVKLEKIDNDTLVLGVYDACWMQELYLLSPLLLTTINESLDQPRIKHLRFKRAVAYKHSVAPLPQQHDTHHKQPELTPREQAALAAIEDQQLRQALHQFLIRCHKENL